MLFDLENQYELALFAGYLVRTLYIALFYYLLRRKIEEPNGSSHLTWRHILDLYVLMYLILRFVSFIQDLLRPNFDPDQAQVDSWFNGAPGLNTEYLVLLSLSIIFAPIVEEIIFRWLYVKIVDNIRIYWFNFPVKLGFNVGIFTGTHFIFAEFDLFFSSWYARSIPGLAIFSIFAYLLYTKSKRLDYVIVFHMITNVVGHSFIILRYVGVPSDSVNIVRFIFTALGAFYLFILYRVKVRDIISNSIEVVNLPSFTQFILSFIIGLTVMTLITRFLYLGTAGLLPIPVFGGLFVVFMTAYIRLLIVYFRSE